jgi:hypothetical protein
MRTRIAWERARRGDAEARAAVAKHYAYVAPPEVVTSALEEFDGHLGDFAAHVRWLLEHPVEASPLATARVDAAEFMRATVTPTPRKKVTEPTGWDTTSGNGDQGPASPKRPEVEPERSSSMPPSAAQEEETALLTEVPEDRTPAAPRSPTVTVAEPPAPPEPRPKAKPARVEVRPVTKPVRSTTTARSEVPVAVHRRAFAAVLASAPRWYWPSWQCVHIEVADGSVLFFGRGDAAAQWYRLQADTTGAASVQVPREGAVHLRKIKGSGPVVLSLYPDRVLARRDGDPITVPAREARLPPVPEVEVKGGVVLSREALAAALEADPGEGEVRLQWDRQAFRVNGLPLAVEYGTGASWEVVLDPRYLLDALRRGTDREVTVEVGAERDPALVTCGCLVAAIAPRSPEVLL